MHTLLHKYYTLECSHPNPEWKNSILLTWLSSASCQVVVVHSIVLPRFCTLWNSRPNVCECFTGPRVIPRVSAVFRGLRVSEGLQRVGGGMGIGVPRSVPASSVPAIRGLTRTRRSTVVNHLWFSLVLSEHPQGCPNFPGSCLSQRGRYFLTIRSRSFIQHQRGIGSWNQNGVGPEGLLWT